jgi:hypothetical protein
MARQSNPKDLFTKVGARTEGKKRSKPDPAERRAEKAQKRFAARNKRRGAS